MSIQDHILRKDNPHEVTKNQVDLGNVLNYPVASVEEIEALSAADRYIKESDLGTVNGVFAQYMKDVGLTNPDGTIKESPKDTEGDVSFEVGPDGSVTLEGTHPTAHSVDVVVTQASSKVFTQNTILVSATTWQAEVSSLVLDTSLPYQLATVYRDATGAQISRSDQVGGNLPEIVGGDAQLVINSEDGSGVVSGNTPGADSVDVEIRENGDLVFSGSNLPVDKTQDDFWTANTGDVVLDPAGEHVITAVGKDAEGNPVGTHETAGEDATTTTTGPVVDLTIPGSGDATLDGYMPGAESAKVTVKQGGSTVFEDANVSVSAADGYWSVDLTSVTFDPSKAYVVTVSGFDGTGKKVAGGSDSTNNPGDLGPDEGALVEYDETQGVYYYDFRHFSNWEDVTIDWLDKGHLPTVV